MFQSKKNIYLVLLLVLFSINYAVAGRCTGSAKCMACTTCNYCKICSQNGGNCGICSSSFSSSYDNNEDGISSGLGKLAIVGGGTYLLYRTFRKKTNNKG